MKSKSMKTEEEKICPNCGYCPTCKRPMQTSMPNQPYPWYWFGPYYPYWNPQPQWTWTSDTVTANTIDTTTGSNWILNASSNVPTGNITLT